MSHYQMGVLETRFAKIIWAHEPVTSRQLVELAAQELNWKKSTTFTVLRRLCDKGIFQNNKGTVTSLLSVEQYATAQSTQFVNETFSGSLPAFLAAFTAGRKLTEKEISELREIIEAQQ
jgi:predicted transcriptional regulator